MEPVSVVFERLAGPREPPAPQHRSRRWSRRNFVLFLVPIVCSFVLVLVFACQPASAGVRSVTAYYDPFWKSRTKRTTVVVQPSYVTYKYFSTQSLPSSTTTTTLSPPTAGESFEVDDTTTLIIDSTTTSPPTLFKQKQRRYRVLGDTKTWIQRPKTTNLPIVLQVQTHELNSTSQAQEILQEISPTDEQPSGPSDAPPQVVRRRRVSSSAEEEETNTKLDQVAMESVSSARYRPLGLEQPDSVPEKYNPAYAPITHGNPPPAAYKTHDNNDDSFWDSMTQAFPKVIMGPEEPVDADYNLLPSSNRGSRYNSYGLAAPSNGLVGDETDLELGESINPFINSSTPFANDLPGSYPNHHLDFLHPLFNSDNDFGTPFKIPENKTVAIEHKLSDTSIGVKVAPDLHTEFSKSQFPLNPDGILTSDHDRQLQKAFPKVHVKTSVSMSTSSSTSSKTSGGGAKKTSPMPTFNIPLLSSAEDTASTKKKLNDYNNNNNNNNYNKPVTRLTIQFSTSPRPYTGETSTTLSTHGVKVTTQQSSITKHASPSPTPAKPLFTLRPKVVTTTTTTTNVPWTVRSTTSTIKPFTQETSVRSSSSSENINTFFDNIDEINGKNKWSPPTSTTTSIPSTTTTKTTTTTPKPKSTEKIKPNKEPPLLLMPPFTNDKDQPVPVTLTTKSATTEKPRAAPTEAQLPPALPPLQGLNDAALLQQLLGILGEQPTNAPQTTRKPTTTTTTRRPPTTPRTAATQADILSLLSLFGQPQTQKPARTPPKSSPSSSSTSLNTNDLLSLLTQPQSNGGGINSNSANDLLSLFGQQPQTQRPATRAPAPQATSNNDILSLLSLFQTTTTRRPTQLGGGSAGGDLLGLFNLFGGGARATTTPAPSGLSGFLGNIGTIFNAFRPQATTPRPASNDLFGGLFNLFTTPAPRTVATKRPTRPAASANAGALDALVQQALLESLGLPGQASNSINSQRAVPASKPPPTTPATTTTTPSTTTVAPEPKTTKSDTLSDEEIREIFKILEKQEGKSSTTTTTTTTPTTPQTTTPRSATRTRIVPTTPAPAYSTRATTTLMPIFRNMLNLFGITDPPQADASSQSSVKISPVFNPASTEKPAGAAATNEDLLLKLINSNQAFNNLAVPTTKAPEQPFDLLSQLLNLGQVVQNVQASTAPTVAPAPQTPPALPSPPLDIQSILAQSWLQQRPETSPSESNLLHLISNQFTPKPQQKPNGLYYWVDLNAFMGDQTNNPTAGLRPKLGQKDYFVKVKRQTLPTVDSQRRRTFGNGNNGYYITH